jgi:hypothetical protein
MDAPLLQALSTKLTNLMNRLRFASAVSAASDAGVDPAAISNWLVDQRERRAKESAIAEEPPLPSY